MAAARRLLAQCLRNRFGRAGILLVVAWSVLELGTVAGYSLLRAEWFSHDEAQGRRSLRARESTAPAAPLAPAVEVPWDQTLHPYLGYGSPRALNAVAQLDDDQAPDAEPFVVVITGGSVAAQVCWQGRRVLRQRLAELPAARGKTVRVRSLAKGGWKQPQQAIAVLYYLLMRGELALLINLDGHNELVDAARVHEQGIHPSYPSLWHWLSANTVQPASLRTIGRIGWLRESRRDLARAAGHLTWSLTATVLWDAADRALDARVQQAQVELARTQAGEAARLPVSRTGPQLELGSRAELLEYSAGIWQRGSLCLRDLVRGAGARYVHFIQPNQYVPGSKPLTEEERRTALDPTNEITAESYRVLRAHAAKLSERGVDVHSLVGLFSEVDETLYVDRCCHLNRKGNEMIANAMADHILASSPSAEPNR
ncbi:MAG: hypothetical protein JRI23_01430 [Deltaproteobacteria bacterium]|nr:hypothetical protein [Deltaproteobacteria bacterium]MBW2530123.1 hypothetical protein [Deltaproteobacteria bacterium]